METKSNLQHGEVLVGTIVASCLSEKTILNYKDWLLCDGRNVPNDCELKNYMRRTPNLCGRTLIGAGPARFIGGVEFFLGDSGGESTHILSPDEIPQHSHRVSNAKMGRGGSDWAHGNGSGSYYTECTAALNKETTHAPFDTDSCGNGYGHNNMQPYYVVNYIIYAKKIVKNDV
ncbi:hypothetical protein DMA11_13850 [Marinilabiliaceae bacterium JC017]|nr:hypothetical protein DMA11_13850 [Marinilabiliaceae bacterium JC017]